MRRSFPPGVRRSKFGAIRTEVDNIVFASKAEARRYGVLKLQQRLGMITDLELQPRFPLMVAGVEGDDAPDGMHVGVYVADFRYYKRDGELVVEDVKGMPTPVYRLKKKLMAALYGVHIQEIS